MKVFGVLTIVSLLLAAQTVMAHSPNNAGPASGAAGALLNQLIYPCQATCLGDEASCIESANDAALAAIEAACPSEVAAAQSACATDHTSKACRSAEGSLGTCAKSSVKDFKSAVSACGNDLETCLDACEG